MSETLKDFWSSVVLVTVHVPDGLSDGAVNRMQSSFSGRLKELTSAPVIVLEQGATIKLYTTSEPLEVVS